MLNSAVVNMGSIKKPHTYMRDLLLLLIVCGCVIKLVNAQDCKTPFQADGECIPARECRIMMDFLKSLKKPYPPELSVPLRGYFTCKEGSQRRVCCPFQGPIIPSFPELPSKQVFTESLETPPSVTNHPNLDLLPTNCGHYSTKNGGDKIYEGEDANLNEFPWMALISYYDRFRRGPRFSCGGTVINDRYILTAAHCISDLKLPLLGVRVGEYDIANRGIDCVFDENEKKICSQPVQDLRIEKVIVHPGYNNQTLANDIGLLRLAKKINLVENVKPICLPIEMDAKLPNFTTVTGWGYVNDDAVTSNVLQRVRLPFVNRASCQEKWGNEVKIDHKQLCAGALDGKGSCKGDSGGPLQVLSYLQSLDDVAYVQHGIVSFGPRQCGSRNIPEVYTRVVYYLDWILNELAP